ncbi:membrane protein [Capnocytophaga stomatis]|uniref:RagB/SusD family nutrient uptake outer membrane protein n=1 Tax=Capnocytophaga stomatis TaxID=1848904 RepID=UPI00194E7DF1|nr:RagB/SusD family nutrient uptake outer membrane protein [Capnocytophaga stomatis]GIJ94773.1 membrane protein [Capnocytophaga stomatis]GIJ97752.1 membrane protein [Capnocytophaga stomatis]GIM49989.1 membrane protein [Capnocytophaga stomatis]
MKTLNYIFIIITLTLVGCNNLEQSPYDSIASKDAFEKVIDARAWVNGMYIRLRSSVYGGYMMTNDVQSDLLNATAIYGGRYEAFHRWETLKPDDINLEDFWRESYRTISNINEALSGFTRISVRDEEERELLNQYTGELHLGRAYIYTRLVTSFCKVYDQATAQSDLGVPLELVFNTKTKNVRASLQETYNQILSDITKAETLLENKNGEEGADTFTIDAVKILKARVLLFMGQWSEAYKNANEILSTYPLASSSEELQKMWHNDSKSESITQLYVAKPDQLPSTNGIYILESRGKVRPYYIPTQWIVDLYGDDDYRRDIYFRKETIEVGFNDDVPDIYIVNKYPGNPELETGKENPDYAHAPKVFRVAEAYLIASEAAFKNNDQANALYHLNEIKKSRGLQTVNLSGNALWEEIKTERLREFAFEGFRLFDLKRWKEPVIRRNPQKIEALAKTLPTTQFHELNRSVDDFRFVWPIPSRDKFHGNLQQNPGW